MSRGLHDEVHTRLRHVLHARTNENYLLLQILLKIEYKNRIEEKYKLERFESFHNKYKEKLSNIKEKKEYLLKELMELCMTSSVEYSSFNHDLNKVATNYDFAGVCDLVSGDTSRGFSRLD